MLGGEPRRVAPAHFPQPAKATAGSQGAAFVGTRLLRRKGERRPEWKEIEREELMTGYVGTLS